MNRKVSAFISSPWTLALTATLGVAGVALIAGLFSYLSHRADVDAKLRELSIGFQRQNPLVPDSDPPDGGTVAFANSGGSARIEWSNSN
jgi:hypothetical protein